MSDSPRQISETETSNLPDLPPSIPCLPVAHNLPDLPVAAVTEPKATENAAAADPPPAPAPAEAPAPWQHGVHSTEREAVIDGIMAAFKKLQNPALPGESDLRPAAEKFEAACFEKEDSKNAYLDKIKRRMERLTTKTAKETTAKASAPAPHPVKSSAREVDWKCAAKGVVLNDKTPFLHPKQLESYKSLPSFKGNSIWAGSMLCNPARASLRAGRPITAAEKDAEVTPLSLITFTKHASPRPVLLATMIPEGNPAKTTLIAMLYHDSEQPAKPVCYDYEGADATERAIATLGSIEIGSKTIKHVCRLHPHVGAMAWSCMKHFNKFYIAGKPVALTSIRRFMVVMIPRANKDVETDFAELCSKNADSDTNALSNKLTTRVEASQYFSLDRPGATEKLTILNDRGYWYTALSAFARKHAHGRIMNENVGGAIAAALEKARAIKPVRPSTADDSDEEMVVAPKPKAGPHRGSATKRSAPDDEDDAADDDSEVEAEDRTVPVKKRSIKKSKHTATPIPDSDAEEKNEESDDESELGDDDDDEDDDENDDEDDEDMEEVSADEAAPGPELTEPEKLKKKVNTSKQPVVPPKPPASSMSKAEGKKPVPPVDKAKEAHTRRAKEAIEVGKKMEASGYGAVKRAVCNAGYSTLMADVNEWWRASGREVPVDNPTSKAKPTEQVLSGIKNRKETMQEQPTSTDHRLLVATVLETVSDFHRHTGLEGNDLHPALLQCTGLVYRAKEYGKLLEADMTATVADDSKESFVKAIAAFNNYHCQLVRLLSRVMAQHNTPSSSSSTTDTPTEGVHRAVSATANNLLKTTPQIAELGAQLAKVSGEFNSLVAKLNSNALSIAEGMEAAVAAQKQ